MLERLLDAAIGAWDYIAPGGVVNEWESGVILRLGVFHRYAPPGFRFKWPIMEHLSKTNAATTTMALPSQTLTTGDDQTVVVSAIVRYAVTDPRPYLTSITDPEGVISDTVQGAVKTVISGMPWRELNDKTPERKALNLVRRQVKPFGFHVELITFSDLGRIKSIRLLTDRKKED